MPRPSFSVLILAATALVFVVTILPTLDAGALTTADALRAILSALLTAVVLSFFLTVSRWSGVRAFVSVALLYWGVSHFNTLTEAIFFGLDLGGVSVPVLVVATVLSAAVVSAGLVFLSGRWKEGAEGTVAPAMSERTTASWAGRIVLAAFCYYVCYFIAGIIVFPFVQDFYANKPLPSVGGLFAMQMVRGSVYAAIGLMLARAVVIGRTATAIAFGAALSILGGLSPLLPPNPLMPEHIRLPHMVEIGISNFVVGMIMMWLLDVRWKKVSSG
jgi:hypothetical protein